MAYYRAGRPAQALDHFSASPSISTVLSYGLFLALTHQALGHEDEARRLLEKSEAKYDRLMREWLASPDLAHFPTNADGWHWWEIPPFLLLRREAWERIKGAQVPDDPWQPLMRARGYGRIDENQKAEAELEAAVRAAPDASKVWAARAGVRMQLGQVDRAEADWQKATELAGKDPMPWIGRGRYYAQRGDHPKADADFAKAASLTPDDLSKFLQAGWWIVGPYPTELDEFCAPELDLDPSKPVHAADPETGLTAQPVRWRDVPTGQWGKVNCRLVGADSGSAYALAYVYSPDERTALLRAEFPQRLRVWVNRQLVYDSREAGLEFVDGRRVPVALRRGRNVLLVKSTFAGTGSHFALRVGDGPADRAYRFAELGLWKEAAELLEGEAARELRSHVCPWTLFSEIALLAGNREAYERDCRELFERYRHTADLWPRVWLAHTLCVAPNPTFDAHSQEITKLALRAREPFGGPENGYYQWASLAVAYALYRTGELAQAGENAARIEAAHLGPLSWPLRAMIAHRQGRSQDAATWLDKALRFDDWQPKSKNWLYQAHFLVSLREAEQLITGTTSRSDALCEKRRALALRQWQTLDPATAAFDYLVTTDSHSLPNFENPGFPWLARGRCLAALKRFDQTESDFNKAVELAPGRPDVRLARAVFLADRGLAEKAAEELHQAYLLLGGGATRDSAHPVAAVFLVAARHPEVLERLAALVPGNGMPWLARARLHVWHGRWKDALADYQRAGQVDGECFGQFVPIECARLHLLLGDTESYRAVCDRVRREKNAPNRHPPRHHVRLRGLVPTADPDQPDPAGALDQLREDGRESARFAAALATFRAGRWEDARRMIAGELRISDRWPNVAGCSVLSAMIHYRLGRLDEARRWLKHSEDALELARRASTEMTDHSSLPQHVGEWLTAQVLSREAKTLIQGSGADSAAAKGK